jgi:excisionase family DNA binding protein
MRSAAAAERDAAAGVTCPARQAALCVRVSSAMSMLGIGKTKLYELLAEGELEAIRVGRRRLILRASIEELVERLRSREG